MEGSIDEDDVSCGVCLELFQLPTRLPCAHCFCRPCALAVAQSNSVLCPLCRAPYGLPLPPVDDAMAALVSRYLTSAAATPETPSAPPAAPPLLRRDEWLVILRMLEKADGPAAVARMAAVCRGLCRVASDPYLWRELCIRDFSFVPAEEEGVRPNWRHRYTMAKKRARGWQQGRPQDWKLSTLRGPESHVAHLQWRNGRVAVTYGDGSASLWDPKTKQVLPDDSRQEAQVDEVAVTLSKRLRIHNGQLELIDAQNAVLAHTA